MLTLLSCTQIITRLKADPDELPRLGVSQSIECVDIMMICVCVCVCVCRTLDWIQRLCPQ